MESTIVSANPPKWWHPHGRKINVEKCDASPNGEIQLKSNAVEILIYPGPQDETYVVEWKLTHYYGNDQSQGKRVMARNVLLAAFGLNGFVGDNPDFSAKWGNAHSALAGQYIRTGHYLNIPCPGTACDGDPNVSIFVEETIQRAISALVPA
jgi:hypothetical protein